MVKHRKHGRKASRKHGRKNRKQTYRKRRTQGGACALTGASIDYDLAKEIGSTSLKQGAEFQGLTKDYHGGGTIHGADIEQVGKPLLEGSAAVSAGIASLDQANAAIANMKDQAGGRRRHKSHKAHRKSHRKSSRKNKCKSRKANRKQRNTRRHRQRQGGGGCLADNAAPFTKDSQDGMLLKDYSGAGLNVEWKDVNAAAGGDYLSPKV
jgi:hypothetical protein